MGLKSREYGGYTIVQLQSLVNHFLTILAV